MREGAVVVINCFQLHMRVGGYIECLSGCTVGPRCKDLRNPVCTADSNMDTRSVLRVSLLPSCALTIDFPSIRQNQAHSGADSATTSLRLLRKQSYPV